MKEFGKETNVAKGLTLTGVTALEYSKNIFFFLPRMFGATLIRVAGARLKTACRVLMGSAMERKYIAKGVK